MFQDDFLRLALYPGRCVPVGPGEGCGWLGVRCDGEELNFHGFCVGRNKHRGDDNVVEGRFAANGGVGLGDGGGLSTEGAIRASTEIEVEERDGALDLDHFANEREDGVCAVQMGG